MSYFICDVVVYIVFLLEVSGLGGEAGWYAALYLLIVVGGGRGAGVHTGLPWRLCGHHKMTAYRLLAVDVMW